MTLTVLAIDDSRTIREMLSASLSDAGFNVHLAVDGQEGLEQLTAVSPDVVITDINMPKMGWLPPSPDGI
ncbi:response regulator, partial [Solirhodobacter olei]|uniref:response regulator n=1 Tax=Solirhodobacter olei TaxID=2493082 RepID=UPI000FD92FC9